jgi:peptidoglycan-N-acetylglucosamine deacetylase
MEKPVFFDASGRRSRWTTWTIVLAAFALLLATAILAATVIDIPRPAPISLSIERSELRAIDTGPARRTARQPRFVPSPHALPDVGTALGRTKPIKVGFYAPWDPSSSTSLANHVEELDWLVPGLFSVIGPDHAVTVSADSRLDIVLKTHDKQPALLPMIQNAVEDEWDGQGAAALLHGASERTALLNRLESLLVRRAAAGIVFDFEFLPDSAAMDYLALLREAKIKFAAHHWLVTVTAPATASDWKLKALAAQVDHVFIMAFDHDLTSDSPGPLASQAWFGANVARAVTAVGDRKSIIAIGNYAYDWTGPGEATEISVEEAWLAAHDSDASINFDAQSGNASFAYEEDGVAHRIWMLDAASAWNQVKVAQKTGAAGLALWRLGNEDPGVWKVLGSGRTEQLPNISAIQSVGNVDVEGEGEILKIEARPSEGSRTVTQGPNGLIANEQYWTLPTPYVVRRTGNKPGYVALTFDDGPDPEWTPQIIAVLNAKKVPGTFFVIGQNALAHPFLLNLILRSGSELGSHTFTHPNLALSSPKSAQLELNVTRRLIEAYTGRSVRMFRAPYFSDAEAGTADELAAALVAQDNGYINIGLHVDPHDWREQSADSIAHATVSQIESATAETTQQIVLLHDGGGDRSQTVAALPKIIDQLQARGYKFVSASALANLSKDDVMPKVGQADLFAARANIGLFLAVAAFGQLLKWLFFAAISLGIVRALVITLLALDGRRKRKGQKPPPFDPDRLVSVIIPAFNEARVIETSIRRVLASAHARIEVIVVDDGSTDGTAAVVEAAFGQNPSVQFLRVRNGGKAQALNHAIAFAHGDIVIALDADTQFEPDTIAKLVRWFRDPAIGAVAGNVKVGNKVNLVTRWQALEYVTAQSLERRALARFDAIMVVPGAVGAFLRSTLDEADGYPADTLAEDQDLTIQVQRNGWKVHYDDDAIAWTEAPQSFRELATQRFRWAYGTLQCLWKHRSILRTRKPRGLALIGIPQTWVFQIFFSLIAPFIDLTLLTSMLTTALKVYQHGWAQSQHDIVYMARFWTAFAAIDIASGFVAYRLEPREMHYPVLLLIAQRFVYRQIMYVVVIRAVTSALRGPRVGWGKLTRSGQVGRKRKRKPQRKLS